jgi:signal transduction histidine kinase
VDDYHTWAGRAAVFEDAPLGAVLAVPVTWAGQILGVINVEREAGAAFDEPEARLLSLFANQVAVALANARLLQQAEARRRHIEALLDINTTLRSTLPLHEVLEMIARRTGEALGYIGTLILVPDANGKELRVAATWGSGLQDALTKVRTRSLSGSRLPLSAEGNPIVQAYLRHDLQTTSGEPERPLAGLNPTVALKRGALLSGAMGAKRGLYLGLHYGDKPQGVLLAFSSRTDLAEEERSLLLGLAGQAGLAIENARLFAEVGAARERLEGLSRRLVTVQEEERRHIARELHDEVGQLLTGLKITMDMAQTAPASETEERLSEAQALVGQLLAQVRELSLALRPAMLDDLGLLPALLWNTNHYSAQTGIHVRFTHYGLRGRHFPPEVETAIYRIAQEALTNVARHAGVIEVAVRVWAAADALILEVHDEGRGFDPVAALAAASPGLVGMHERVTLLGGQLVVESAPGKGTSVRATFPIDGTAPDRKEG